MAGDSEMDFCVAVNCIDGRVQEPVAWYLRRLLGVSYVDMVTEPGPVKLLANGEGMETVDAIVRRVAVSIAAHESRTLAVVAHEDCAGNPVGQAEQVWQLGASVQFLAARFPKMTTIGLWVAGTGEVSEVCRSEAGETGRDRSGTENPDSNREKNA